MKKGSVTLYNVIFPIWLLWLFPISWVVILPANFAIDLLVLFLAFCCLKVSDRKRHLFPAVFKVWLFGFLADFVGAALMYVPNLLFASGTGASRWWYDNIVSCVNFNPFGSVWGVLWVTVCVAVTGCFIYLFHNKIALKRAGLTDVQRKKTALALAVFTAPYLFYLPTEWFYY